MATGTASFPRQIRLTRPADYTRVFKQARTRSTDALMTVLAVSNDLHHARLGLAISRKAARSAVARNRIKRLIRESFRANHAVIAGLDVVVLGGRNLQARGNVEIRRALLAHWNYLSRTCKSS